MFVSVESFYNTLAAQHYGDVFYAPSPTQSYEGWVNYVRIQRIMSAIPRSAKSIYEFGVGDGRPLQWFAERGFRIAGCDLSPQMIVEATKRLPQNTPLCVADIADPLQLATHLALAPFDVLTSLGSFSCLRDDAQEHRTLEVFRAFSQPGTRLFIECRNKLFALTTFNRYTIPLWRDIYGTHPFTEEAIQEIETRCRMDQPPVDQTPHQRWHNPLTITPLLAQHGFHVTRLHFYHHHPTLPWLFNSTHPQHLKAAQQLEDADDWRGYFRCSAFLVEAQAVGERDDLHSVLVGAPLMDR